MRINSYAGCCIFIGLVALVVGFYVDWNVALVYIAFFATLLLIADVYFGKGK